MRHGSLFSGIGGFDLAAEWMGWENVFHCEWNEFGQKILKHYWPNAKSYGDITKTDFSVHRGKIDIITGGFPCQPYSVAGKRKGKEDDRHLWPEMLRAIREVQPRWIVGENVPGLLNWEGGLVLDEIKTDLEAAGFEIFPPLVLPACGLNAPHRRDRLWVIAYSNKQRFKGERKQPVRGEKEEFEFSVLQRAITNPHGSSACEIGGNNEEMCSLPIKKSWTKNSTAISGGKVKTNASHPNNQGLQGSEINGSLRVIGKDGNEQLTGFFQPTWQEFPTQSPLCGRDDGISNRVDRIKALGNAIVPQVAYEIFKAIEECT